MAALEWTFYTQIVFIGPIIWILFSCLAVFPVVNCIPQLIGFRIESNLWNEVENGRTTIYASREYVLRLYGNGFLPGGHVSFTSKLAKAGENCNDLRTTPIFAIIPERDDTATATIKLPLQLEEDNGGYYFCLKGDHQDNVTLGQEESLIHQGNATWLHIETKEWKPYLLPLWLQVIIIIVLLVFSGLFSGLNLGLMSLDKTELDIMINSGTSKEKRYAKKIKPLRKRGNFLLCTILLGNVLVNNTLAILLDDLTGSGMAAIIGATLSIVIFGEIIPQAICSRHGLAVGAHTIWFTRIFMVITFPLSYPISKLLDSILGEEIGYVYNRDRLRELLRLTEQNMDLAKDELNIIAGALELTKKTVKDIMTKLEDVFMVEYNSVLDFDTLNEIMKTGYSRIPVYENERTNIVALLNIKDLAFIDPDDRTPLKTVTKFYNHPVNCVFEDTKLDIMLQDFKKGRSHMAFVQKVNSDGPGDPFYETVGLVTCEDVLEEIIQSEIIDETDTVTDNRAKAPRKMRTKDFSVFSQPDNHNYPQLSSQQALATYQFLSANVLPFRTELISEQVLQKLIKQNVIVNFRFTEPSSCENYLYRSGKQSDSFIMILQGRVEVEFGKENLTFEGGPFTFFGVNALTGSLEALSKQTSTLSIISLSELNSKQPLTPYVSDFTVRAKTDLQYIRIRRAHYLVARRATLMERHHRVPQGLNEDQFEEEFRQAHQSAALSDQAKSDTDSIRDDISPKDVIVKGFSGDEKASEENRRKSPKRMNSDSLENVQASVEVPLIGSMKTNVSFGGDMEKIPLSKIHGKSGS